MDGWSDDENESTEREAARGATRLGTGTVLVGGRREKQRQGVSVPLRRGGERERESEREKRWRLRQDRIER